jgi:Putative restriction endonuclease
MMTAMDEKHAAYSLKAPGRSGPGAPMHLPGRGPFPRVDDHLVQPEITRDEIIGGQRVVASPAKPPHAKQHSRLDYVLQAHTAAGYAAATDLLTRHDRNSDFATDACIYKDEIDPETGDRHLEEIAFEVVSEQNESLVTEKAAQMHRRGVRRIFTVWVKGRQRVCEWSPESRSWRPLDQDSSIEDPLLVAPLSVTALLDAAAADNAVAEALIAKGNPILQARELAARAEAKAQDILEFLDARGIAVSPSQRQTILGCSDLDRLDRWVRRAAVASSADEVTS